MADEAALSALPEKERLGSETSAKQVFDRLAGCWTYWGYRFGYFDTEDDALRTAGRSSDAFNKVFEIKREIERTGAWSRPSQYSDQPYLITRGLIEEAAQVAAEVQHHTLQIGADFARLGQPLHQFKLLLDLRSKRRRFRV